ncbi:hypothetical protein TRV_01745, partial [Trichophyton verrucosum HKI 0517]
DLKVHVSCEVYTILTRIWDPAALFNLTKYTRQGLQDVLQREYLLYRSLWLPAAETCSGPLTSLQVTMKPGAPDEALAKAKESAKKTGGTIRHEYKLIRGFTVEYPNDHNLDDVLKSNDHIHVEQDGPGPAKKVTATSTI